MDRLAIRVFLASFVSIAVACDGGTVQPSVPDPSDTVVPTAAPPPCPGGSDTCLAWDDFDRPDGPISEALTGQTWTAQGLACSECGPSFAIRDGRATITPGSEKNSVWLATLDTGRASGLVVTADVRLSPTRRRANIGIVALFADPQNNLVCKIEVTDGNPKGLIAIGDELAGRTTSLLSYRKDIGLRNGNTYRITLTVPPRPERRPVRCRVSGSEVGRRSVKYQLTSERLAAYGSGTGQGLRIKIYEDEDDGNSAWEEFLVVPARPSST